MNYLFDNFGTLWRKFTSSAVINTVGLSVALLVFFVVLIQVRYDFTYDKGYRRAERIHLLSLHYAGWQGRSDFVSFPLAEHISETVPEVEGFCLLAQWGGGMYDIERSDGSVVTQHVPGAMVTPGFRQVFTPEIVRGDTTGLFTLPGKAMISQQTAERLFGTADPIGQVLRLHYGGTQYTVQAVYRDFPENSSLPNGLYTALHRHDGSEWSFQAYYLVDPGQLTAVNDKINSAQVLGEDMVAYMTEHPDEQHLFRLAPLSKHYLTDATRGGSRRISTTVSLLVIGVLTLLIAFVNFVNLSLAMAPARVRSVNIRKILGIDKTILRLTIAGESVLFTLTALVVALFGLYVLQSTTFARSVFSADLTIGNHAGLLAAAGAGVLLVSWLIGLYAMRYTTSCSEAEALKGSFATGVKASGLRHVLIVVQFATAIALICISVVIRQQNDYMLHYDWGLDREHVVYVPIAGLGDRADAFGQELLRDTRIKDYTISRMLPGEETMSWGRDFEGKNVYLTVWSVDERFLDFFGVQVIAGKKPDHKDSIMTQLVVNEAFLKEYEFDESIVGKDFDAFGPGRIQGVAENIHFMSLHVPIGPMAFGVLAKWNNFQYVLVKLSGSDMHGAIQQMEQTWRKFSNEPFEVHFLDDHMDRLYQKETNMAKLIGLFGLIIVLIAVMGVYGLILFNTKYKAKEIAIRKVNGASEREILLMLNRSMLVRLGIAFVMAVPVAYYFIQRWLENFAYKISVHGWVFLLGGLAVLMITLATVSVQSYKSATANPTEALNKE